MSAGFFVGSPEHGRVKEMIIKYADRRRNIINLPGSIYIIDLFMEKALHPYRSTGCKQTLFEIITKSSLAEKEAAF